MSHPLAKSGRPANSPFALALATAFLLPLFVPSFASPAAPPPPPAPSAPHTHAETLVQRLAFDSLCSKADRIFRGRVLRVTPGTLAAGGGTLPTVTYHLEVVDAMAGRFGDSVQLTMVGEIHKPAGTLQVRRLPILELPDLTPGNEYLLFTTRPSKVGLCTTVGLGQGCFAISGKAGQEYAVNALNNAGLGLGGSGPVEYKRLVRRIRQIRDPKPVPTRQRE